MIPVADAIARGRRNGKNLQEMTYQEYLAAREYRFWRRAGFVLLWVFAAGLAVGVAAFEGLI